MLAISDKKASFCGVFKYCFFNFQFGLSLWSKLLKTLSAPSSWPQNCTRYGATLHLVSYIAFNSTDFPIDRFPQAHLHQGHALAALQRFEEAEAAYQRGKSLKPRDFAFEVALKVRSQSLAPLGRPGLHSGPRCEFLCWQRLTRVVCARAAPLCAAAGGLKG